MKWTSLLIIAMTLAGCGVDVASMPPPETVIVTGKAVQPNGQPINGGRIRFSPAEGAAGAEAYADIQADGTFKLQSFGGRDGAMPGTYRVSLSGKAMAGLPPKFQAPESTTIRMDITKEKSDLGAIRFQ